MEITRWQAVRYAVRQFFECWWTVVDMRQRREGWGYYTTPLHVTLVEALLLGPCFAAYQAWAYFMLDPWNGPVWPADFFCSLHNKLDDWCEPRRTHYTWLPPDSNAAPEGFREVGLHCRSDLVGDERTRMFINITSPA